MPSAHPLDTQGAFRAVLGVGPMTVGRMQDGTEYRKAGTWLRSAWLNGSRLLAFSTHGPGKRIGVPAGTFRNHRISPSLNLRDPKRMQEHDQKQGGISEF